MWGLYYAAGSGDEPGTVAPIRVTGPDASVFEDASAAPDSLTPYLNGVI